jgi:hypothetical protein
MSGRVACGASSLARTLLAHKQASNSPATNPSGLPSGNRKRGSKSIVNGANSAVDPEKVLRAFNTWSFKREQPSDPQQMLRVIANAIVAQAPVRFALYWGKGPRHDVGGPENECLDFLNSMTSRLQAVYAPGAALTLIFTDTHARLNGHPEENIRRYFAGMTSLCGQRGIASCWLGSLVKASGHLATAAPLETLPPETLSSLVASAQKWYRGPGTAEEGALAYLRMNLIERRVVERTFPNSIFVTFNGSEMRNLFPHQLPIFYMYSLRRGMSVKPWFLPSEPVKSDDGAETLTSL